MIRGYPIGSQIIIGSLPSGLPRGPSPGLAAACLACAHGVIGGDVALSEKLVPRATRAHQMPERSCGSKAGGWPSATAASSAAMSGFMASLLRLFAVVENVAVRGYELREKAARRANL